jgi:hypothetical protein
MDQMNQQVACTAKDLCNLFAFMLLFRIRAFEIASTDRSRIRARVWQSEDGPPEWVHPDELWQEIEWKILRGPRIDDAITLAMFVASNDLVDLDRFKVSPEHLRLGIEWESERFEAALNVLLSFRVDMVDDGEISGDFFFVHF